MRTTTTTTTTGTPSSRRSRSRSPACRCTRATGSPRPSASWASGWSSTSRSSSGDCDATVTDRVEDTVDYAEVCEQVALAAQERSYRTLERLCAAVADRLIDRYDADSVRVKATKPEPPIALPVDEVSVEVWKEA